jgi:hypothetical protein
MSTTTLVTTSSDSESSTPTRVHAFDALSLVSLPESDTATLAPGFDFDADSDLPSYSPPAPLRPGVSSAPSITADATTHQWSLTNRNQRPWATLKLKSRARATTHRPYFFQGDILDGEVELNLERPDSIRAIEVEVSGFQLSETVHNTKPPTSRSLVWWLTGLWNLTTSFTSRRSCGPPKGPYLRSHLHLVHRQPHTTHPLSPDRILTNPRMCPGPSLSDSSLASGPSHSVSSSLILSPALESTTERQPITRSRQLSWKRTLVTFFCSTPSLPISVAPSLRSTASTYPLPCAYLHTCLGCD